MYESLVMSASFVLIMTHTAAAVAELASLCIVRDKEWGGVGVGVVVVRGSLMLDAAGSSTDCTMT